MIKPDRVEQRVFQETANAGTVSMRLLARQLGLQPPLLLGKLRPLVKQGLLVLGEGGGNMAAIGEHWRGVARDVENFDSIAIGTGAVNVVIPSQAWNDGEGLGITEGALG